MDTFTTLVFFTAFSCVFWRVNAELNKPIRASMTLSEKEILDMLLDNYDNKLRPKSTVNGTAGPTVVKVNFLIRSITKVDHWNMELSTQLIFRLEWSDARLAYDDGNTHEYLLLTDPYRIWMPDIFFQNEKSAHLHNILTPNIFFRIYPNGNVLMSIRLSVTVGCPMDLRLFPMDRQVCEIRMASYGSSEKDIVLEWKTDPTDPAYTPVQTSNFAVARFDLQKVSSGDCSSKTVTGSYSCLNAALLLLRQSPCYLVHIYIPTFVLVCVSWVSFWLDREAIVGRALLGVTALIGMLTIHSGIDAHLPPVSYTKAIDVWNGFCFALVFGALLESASVNHCTHKDKSRQRKESAKKKRNDNAKMDEENFHQASYQNVTSGTLFDTETHSSDILTAKNAQPRQRSFLGLRIPSKNSKRLDFFSRLMFPGVFLAFNLVYWGLH